MNKPTLRFWVFRHAPVLDTSKIYGSSDLPVKNYGLDIQNLEKLAIPQNCQIITSPLIRATILANEIKNKLNLSAGIKFDDRLIEQQFGVFEQSKPQLEKYEHSRPYMHFQPDYTPPKGESYLDLRKRVNSFLDEIVKIGNNEDYLICTHGGVIRAMLGYILNLSDEQTMVFDLKPISLTLFENRPNTYGTMLWWVRQVGQNFLL